MDHTQLEIIDHSGNRYRLVKVVRVPRRGINSEKFRKWLKAERNRQKITQNQLAARTGLKQSNIAAIENGRRKPRPETIKKIHSALGHKDSD